MYSTLQRGGRAFLFTLLSVSAALATPDTPAFIGAKGISAAQINISWSPSLGADLPSYYRVYRNGSLIGTVQAVPNNSTYKEPSVYQDIGLAPGVTYTYHVTAVSGAESAPSPTVTATTRPAGQSGLIPPERRVSWVPGVTVGVPGGIPARTHLIDVTQAPYHADKTGASDASVVINQAIADAQAGDVIYLPAGTYRMNASLYIGRSDVTVRGAGMGQTRLDCRSNTCAFFRAGDGFYNAPSTQITGGATRGSTQLTLSDASLFTVDRLVQITDQNDPSLPVLSVYGFNGLRRQVVRVTAKSGNSITVEPPLMMPSYFGSLKATVNQIQITMVGVEDMAMDASGSGGITTVGIVTSGVQSLWVKNVYLKGIANRIITVNDGLFCEIRGSILEGGNVIQPNHGGLFLEGTTGCLVEDNIIINSFPNLEINAGSAGNVFAYNFLKGSMTDMSHSPHNTFNLYEGNIIDGGLMTDGYFGSDSDETIFRNWIVGTSFISLKRFSRNFSIVGNQMDHSGLSFGQPNIGNGSSEGYAAPSGGFYWQDWSPVTGLGIRGTLTTRNSNTSGVITIQQGAARLRGYCHNLTNGNGCLSLSLAWDGDKILFGGDTPVWSGNTMPFNANYGDPLPAVGTEIGIWPRAEGFQERDLDVGASTLMKANWYSGITGAPYGVDESLHGDTLPASLYRSAKPAFFGNLAWPPFSPTQPVLSNEAIPAGNRYAHGGIPIFQPITPGGNGPVTLTLPAYLPLDAQITAGYTGTAPASFEWSFVPNNATPVTAAVRAKIMNNAPSATLQTPSASANLSSAHLELGPYTISVRACDASSNCSVAASANVTLVSANLSGVRVFPNPWRANRHAARSITFDTLTVDTTIKIFTVSGHHVKTLPKSSTTTTWDLTNESGDTVASGMYLYSMTTSTGDKKTGQIVVIR